MIEDVDATDSDDELWDWIVREVLLPTGIEVTPWMRQTMKRDLAAGTVTIPLNIELIEGEDPRPTVN